MKSQLTLVVYCLLLVLPGVSWLPQPAIEKTLTSSFIPVVKAGLPGKNPSKKEIFLLYSSLQLKQKGLSLQAFETGFKGYRQLLKKGIIDQQAYLTICDFSQSSNNKRLYLIDLSNNEIILNTYVAHGRNSGGEYATRFSNKPESYQSSLGFYLTKNTYYGEHGLSMRVAGLEAGYNDKANRRNIVVHGADYIGNDWKRHSSYMGRSFGCPAIPEEDSKSLINTIKNGSCLFIYHPSPKYLKGSKILNG
ncbi:MAG: murein L,D-transpeptidase catalytic domain family protein [Chitinophagaceae bacterium]